MLTEKASWSPQAVVEAVRRSRFLAVDSVWVPLTIYLLSRAVTTLFLMTSARDQNALTFATPIKVTHPMPSGPSLLEVATNWDGQWYWEVVDNGYPSALPPSGSNMLQSPIAFYPGYPTLVAIVMRLTGAAFPAVAVTLSIIFGGLAVVLLHRVLRQAVSPFAATANITLLCVWPAAAVMQVAYTESLALLLIVLSIRWLTTHRYALAGASVLALGLVRPLTVPLAIVVLFHGFSRWKSRDVKFSRREQLRVLSVLVCCIIGTLIWPAIAGWRTSDPLAYFHAMEAWAAPGDRWGGWFGILSQDGEWLLLCLIVLMLAVVLYALRPRKHVRTWPLEVRVWSAGYIIFVLASTIPSIGIARYALLMLVPFWPFSDDSENERPIDRRARWIAFGVLTLMCLAAQYWWVSTVFVIDDSPLSQSYP